MPTRLTRVVAFRATHALQVRGASEAENRAQFGWTADRHAHAYRVRVTVEGMPDPVTGLVVDLAALDRLLDAQVVTPLHDTHLNESVDACRDAGQLAVCEVLATWCWKRIAPHVRGSLRVVEVEVAEDETLSASYLPD